MNEGLFAAAVTGIVSVLVVFITAYFNNKSGEKDSYRMSIADNRIEWIQEVRNLLGVYLEEYHLPDNQKKLRALIDQIQLYMFYKNKAEENILCEQKMLHEALEESYANYGNETYSLDKLVVISQMVLKCSWERMKAEAKGEMNEDELVRNNQRLLRQVKKEYQLK